MKKERLKKDPGKKHEKEMKEPVCQPMHTYEYYLIKFSRVCAWSMIVMVILYFLTGWGMTKTGMIMGLTGGVLHRFLANQIHHYLILPMAFAFICHTLISIRFAMIRWKVKNKIILNYAFLGSGVVLFGLVCYAYFV